MQTENTVIVSASPKDFHKELFGGDILFTTIDGKRLRLVAIAPNSDMASDFTLTTNFGTGNGTSKVLHIPDEDKNFTEREKKLVQALTHEGEEHRHSRELWIIRYGENLDCYAHYHGDVWLRVSLFDQVCGRTSQLNTLLEHLNDGDAVRCNVCTQGELTVIEGSYGMTLLAKTKLPDEVARGVMANLLLPHLYQLKQAASNV